MKTSDVGPSFVLLFTHVTGTPLSWLRWYIVTVTW